ETVAAAVDPAAAGEASGASDASRLHHTVFTWRNALVGGVLAFALLGVVVAGYFVMWSTGVGPVGNLVAQGVIDEGDRVVLATFADATGEGLGDVVTEALRVDLSESSVLQLVEDVDVAPVLARMQVEPGTPLTADLAREVAVREGIKAYLEGEVSAAGTAYLVTATLRAADGGRSIASFRVTADGPDEIIASIDKLSQDIREKSGETLRSIKAGEPLERVTTRSTEALRLYSDADRAFDQGDDRRTLELLDQAVALDPAFAMAWRKMGATLNNTGTDEARERHAATQAFEHRDRLTERERYLAEAYYYSTVEEDRGRTIAAYQNVLRVAPDDRAALNNLANEYQAIEDFERARELYRRAVDGPGRSNTAYQNLVRNRIGADDFEGAWQVYLEYEDAYPNEVNLPESRFWAAYVNDDLETARAAAEPLIDDPAQPAFVRAAALERMAHLAYRMGRLEEGRRRFLDAQRVAGEVGPAYALVRRQWAVHSEWALGDAEWARRHAREPVDDGTWDAIDPEVRPYYFVVLNLAVAGDRKRAERVLADWEAAVPGEERGVDARTSMERIRIYLDVGTGGGEGAPERLREAAEAHACTTCWKAEEAWIAERIGRTDEAIRL
ncbi:MAG TPA: hypothetical protein VLL48_09125, partial [Longimicrobiales bacterium]|nr:hypothetical protein [Longimicrobiales bacterium]